MHTLQLNVIRQGVHHFSCPWTIAYCLQAVFIRKNLANSFVWYKKITNQLGNLSYRLVVVSKIRFSLKYKKKLYLWKQSMFLMVKMTRGKRQYTSIKNFIVYNITFYPTGLSTLCNVLCNL